MPNRSSRLPFGALALLPLLLLTSGCQTIGPRGIEEGRQAYNEAIQRTNDEQLLLNLVRLQYRDTPLFLQIGSVSSQMRLDAGADVRAGFRSPGRALESYGGGARIGVSDTPTVSYTPLQGEDFTEHLLRPISIESVFLLYHSGWSIERVLRLTVQRVNGERNAFNASGPTPGYPPRFENFALAARHLRTLQIQDGIDVGFETEAGARTPYLYVMPKAAESREWLELAEILKVDPTRRAYPVRSGTGLGDGPSDEIIVNTRSLMGVLYFLSQSVNVPDEHRSSGLVTTTRHADGQEFDWSVVLRNLIQIKSSRRPPPQPAVSVQYRGHWFYIDDADLEAKSTFSLVSQLFQLETGSHALAAPVLTLPIGN